jgi:predicted SAM-dependent methyltransferase
MGDEQGEQMSNKVHFCCGGNKFEGWSNHDRDIDITKKLPFEDDSVDFIYCEHGLEHVPFRDGYNFLTDCNRILKEGGVFRLALPFVDVMIDRIDDEYINIKSKEKRWMRKLGFSEMNKENALYQIMFGYRHKAVYTTDLLVTIGRNIGYDCKVCEINVSEYEELKGLDGSGRGDLFHSFYCQTGVVELTK